MGTAQDELVIVNRTVRRDAYPQPLKSILSLDGARMAQQVIHCFPNSVPTPLRSLDLIASRCGVASVAYKDESNRLGQRSFKALGGPYALVRVAADFLSRIGNLNEVNTKMLVAGRYADRLADLCVTAATDGNHGMALAWAAKKLGCHCRIYLHAHVAPDLDQKFEQLGAKVIRVPGNYDDAVRQCQVDANSHGHVVVSDTSYDGYTEVPRLVMEGYAVLCLETFNQLESPPTHIFLQAGVGSFAAAMLGAFWEEHIDDRPLGIIVEPTQAACLFASAKQGRPVTIGGQHLTAMDGLACGQPSKLAWEIISQAASAFMTVRDQDAQAAVDSLAQHSIWVGPSGAAGLAGLQSIAGNQQKRDALQLDSNSRILVIGTEAKH